MKRAFAFGALLVFHAAALVQPALAQPALTTDIQTRLDFEDGREGFQPFGPTAKISLTREADNVKQGHAALRFDYQVAPEQLNAMLLTGEVGAAANIKSFRFWVKADYETNLVMVLQEHESGRYMAQFHAPANQWQRVELGLKDFMLSNDKDDPKDPNGKLDMDMVEAVAIGDLSQLFVQAKDENLKKLFGVKTGPHAFFLDDFWASDQALPPTPGVDAQDPAIIDAFTAPQLAWLMVNGTRLVRVTSQELAAQGAPNTVRERGLQAQYHQNAGVPVGLLRGVAPGQLKDMVALKFTVATEKPLVLLVQLEEKSGGKYNTTIDLPGQQKPMDIRLVPKLFGKADDSKDDNNRLDLDQVKQIVFLDLTSLLGQGDGDNQLWLSNLRVEKEEQ